MVQVLWHAIVHPQVYVDLIHNAVPKSHFHILIYVGRTIDLYSCKSTDSFRFINPLLIQANTLFAFITVSEVAICVGGTLNLYQMRFPSLCNYQLSPIIKTPLR